jgi:hypothetical protein
METLNAAAGDIDVGALESMKDVGVGAEDGAGTRVAKMYEEYHRAEQTGEAAATSGNGAEAGDGTPESEATQPQVVAASALKAFLPTEAAGLPRTHVEHRSQAFGITMTIAQADADYRDGDRRLSLRITDYAETAASGMLPGASWMLFDVDRESSSGYEKTTTLGGHPTKETLRHRGASMQCKLEMVVGKRFLLTVDATNVPMEDVRAIVLDQIGPDQLAQLGRPAA